MGVKDHKEDWIQKILNPREWRAFSGFKCIPVYYVEYQIITARLSLNPLSCSAMHAQFLTQSHPHTHAPPWVLPVARACPSRRVCRCRIQAQLCCADNRIGGVLHLSQLCTARHAHYICTCPQLAVQLPHKMPPFFAILMSVSGACGQMTL